MPSLYRHRVTVPGFSRPLLLCDDETLSKYLCTPQNLVLPLEHFFDLLLGTRSVFLHMGETGHRQQQDKCWKPVGVSRLIHNVFTDPVKLFTPPTLIPPNKASQGPTNNLNFFSLTFVKLCKCKTFNTSYVRFYPQMLHNRSVEGLYLYGRQSQWHFQVASLMKERRRSRRI